MFDKKLRVAVQKYLDADTKPSKSGAKGAITKLINAASPVDIMLIPGILQEFQELPQWLKLRFKKGSLYEEGDRVFGWYEDSQIQAVELPVSLEVFQYDDGENDRVVKYIKVAAEMMGFAPAIDLPFNGLRVEVPVAPGFDFDYTFLTMWKHGWASPCSLQWSWFERPIWSELEGYVVERSIIPYGFWKAWKWWPDCWRWYYEKRPELFEDANWLGAELPPVRHSPPNNPYAAVLGNANKDRHLKQMFFLDD